VPIESLASGGSTAGFAASLAKPGRNITGIGDVRFWPKADISYCAAHVCLWG
jgi:hypothetical protein